MPTNLTNNQRLSGFVLTSATTSGGVTVSQSGTTGHVQVVTHISASSDVAGVVTIESPASTILWQKRITGTGWTISETFADDLIVGASGSLIQVKVNSSTATCQANLGGYTKLG